MNEEPGAAMGAWRPLSRDEGAEVEASLHQLHQEAEAGDCSPDDDEEVTQVAVRLSHHLLLVCEEAVQSGLTLEEVVQQLLNAPEGCRPDPPRVRTDAVGQHGLRACWPPNMRLVEELLNEGVDHDQGAAAQADDEDTMPW